jgi:hypothetical protein
MGDGRGTEVAKMAAYKQIDHGYHLATQMQWIHQLAQLAKLQLSQKKKDTERKAAVINAETKDTWPEIVPKESRMLGQLRQQATAVQRSR